MRASIRTMSRTATAGVLLAVAVAAVMTVGTTLRLQLGGYALAGVLVGGVAALVPDRSLVARLLGVAAGVAAAWAGFVVRAAVMPDTDAGRTVAAVVTVLLATVIALVPRMPLWAVLLGAAAFAAAYESSYSAAPPEIMSTSLDAITGLGVAMVAGFMVSALPGTAPVASSAPVLVPEPRGGADASVRVGVKELAR